MATASSSTSKKAPPTKAMRAFAYLRVSTDDQTRTDYSQDGLSIDAQRAGVHDKADQLGAEIVGEYSDPGKSAFVDLHKRTGFLAMLDELKTRNADPVTRVDYVIVWALSRWARNTVDHWTTRDVIRRAGARLISITEPMAGEDTAAAFLYESIIATHNQFQSMQTSESVKRGLKQKARVGGSAGPARLGYVNTVDQLPDGRRVAIVEVDPERGPFITAAFQLYSSGEYSISELAAELKRLGLSSRATKRYASRPLGTSAVQRMLRNRYYAGWVIYKPGTADEAVFRGRHDPLVDEDTFDRVQVLLDEKRLTSERAQVTKHYLRGSVFCGACQRRLMYGESTGRNSRRYAYYFCPSRINGGDCTQRVNMRPELIEAAIERYYRERPVELSTAEVERRVTAIEALVATSQAAVAHVRTAKAALIVKLKQQQQRLIRMYAEEGDSVSPDAFRDERLRMQQEIEAAEESLAETEGRLVIEADLMRMALELAGDVSEVYAVADEATRRSYNLAFFTCLYVMPDWDEDGTPRAKVVADELTEPYEILLDPGLEDGIEADLAVLCSTQAKGGPYEPPSTTEVSTFIKLAEREGFEPSMELITPYSLSRRVPSATRPPLRAEGV